MFSLEFKTGNSAFHDDEGRDDETAARIEAARILRDVARRIEEGSDGATVHDINGNSIGTWSLY